MSDPAADSTAVDHELNEFYRAYWERYGNWWSPEAELRRAVEIVPTFAEFIALQRQEAERERRRVHKAAL